MENNQESPENESYSDKYKGEALNAYKSFDEALKIRSGDNFMIKIAKVLGRVLGISLFIFMSPFVILGLFLAFVAAG